MVDRKSATQELKRQEDIESAGEALLKEFANLGLIIIIRNVEHFHLDFDRQRLQKEINIDY